MFLYSTDYELALIYTNLDLASNEIGSSSGTKKHRSISSFILLFLARDSIWKDISVSERIACPNQLKIVVQLYGNLQNSVVYILITD